MFAPQLFAVRQLQGEAGTFGVQAVGDLLLLELPLQVQAQHFLGVVALVQRVAHFHEFLLGPERVAQVAQRFVGFHQALAAFLALQVQPEFPCDA